MSYYSFLSNEDKNEIKYNFLDANINDLNYVGINMKPCEYCIHNKGIHYHNVNLNYNSIGYNYIDNKHMCKICKENPGKLHIHLNK